MSYNYDWWFRGAYQQHIDEAKRRCALNRRPEMKPDSKAQKEFLEQIEVRTVVYLRDGFSYEIKELVTRDTTSAITFECQPADEAYRVGCFIVSAPYEDIARVEMFAVHSGEKPEDSVSIKGFGGTPPPAPAGRIEERPHTREA